MAKKWEFNEIFGAQLTFDMFCAVKSLKVKLTSRSEFPNAWGEYKNHSNPYIQSIYILPYPVIVENHHNYLHTAFTFHVCISGDIIIVAISFTKWRYA